jgi:hypothetical protein
MSLRKVHQHDAADQLVIVEYVEVVAGPVIGCALQNEIGAHAGGARRRRFDSERRANNTQLDNYSTRGNYNPYTGSYGTRSRRY